MASHLLLPTVRGRRSTSAIQPNFFTSSHFIDPLRSDIDSLLKAFVDRCKTALANKEDPPKPFEWFKEVWSGARWDLWHLRSLDARARKMFLEVTLRCFLEKVREDEPVLHRLTALCAIYTLFRTQPSTSTTGLYALPYIPVPIDIYEDLLSIPSTLPPTFDHYATWIILSLHSPSTSSSSSPSSPKFPTGIFHLLPSSHLHPQSPPILPDSKVSIIPDPSSIDDTHTQPEGEQAGKKGKLKTGRPSASELQRRAVRAVGALEAWGIVNSSSPPPPPASSSPSTSTSAPNPAASSGPNGNGNGRADAESSREVYESSKSLLITHTHTSSTTTRTLSAEKIRRAEMQTIAKVRELEMIHLRQQNLKSESSGHENLKSSGHDDDGGGGGDGGGAQRAGGGAVERLERAMADHEDGGRGLLGLVGSRGKDAGTGSGSGSGR